MNPQPPRDDAHDDFGELRSALHAPPPRIGPLWRYHLDSMRRYRIESLRVAQRPWHRLLAKLSASRASARHKARWDEQVLSYAATQLQRWDPWLKPIPSHWLNTMLDRGSPPALLPLATMIDLASSNLNAARLVKLSPQRQALDSARCIDLSANVASIASSAEHALSTMADWSPPSIEGLCFDLSDWRSRYEVTDRALSGLVAALRDGAAPQLKDLHINAPRHEDAALITALQERPLERLSLAPPPQYHELSTNTLEPWLCWFERPTSLRTLLLTRLSPERKMIARLLSCATLRQLDALSLDIRRLTDTSRGATPDPWLFELLKQSQLTPRALLLYIKPYDPLAELFDSPISTRLTELRLEAYDALPTATLRDLSALTLWRNLEALSLRVERLDDLLSLEPPPQLRSLQVGVDQTYLRVEVDAARVERWCGLPHNEDSIWCNDYTSCFGL
jgi:hypothetical protein